MEEFHVHSQHVLAGIELALETAHGAPPLDTPRAYRKKSRMASKFKRTNAVLLRYTGDE
jgi:hypothetical protein